MIRTLEEQFEQATVLRIRTLMAALEELSFPTGTGRYLLAEIKRCLEAGLLLAGIQLAASLFEMLVKDLVILAHVREAADRGDPTTGGPEEFAQVRGDDFRRAGFRALVSELLERGLIDERDAERARTFHAAMRRPLLQGFSGRYDLGDHASHDGGDYSLVLRSLDREESASFFEFESRLEDEGLDHLEVVVNFMARYVPLWHELNTNA